MKIFLSLFERPFKIQKDGVFLFEISFFVLEILTFFYYAVMTSYGLQQKSENTESTISLEILKQCS